MANPDLAPGALLKANIEPGVVSRRKRRAQDAQALQEAYSDVDKREGGFCQVTGRYTLPGAPDARVRREHHHLKGRNVKPEWVTRPERIALVCAEAHALITAGWIAVEGTDARRVLRFHWTELVRGRRPFEIQSRRGKD
jgi:hypothetical protein